MWYFTWTLGIGAAVGFGIINAMWLDANGRLAAQVADHADHADHTKGRRS